MKMDQDRNGQDTPERLKLQKNKPMQKKEKRTDEYTFTINKDDEVKILP
jgi:hypothetical protein